MCVCACTRVALFWISVHDDIRNPSHDLLDQTISQCGHSVMIILCPHTRMHTNILRLRMFGCISQVLRCLRVFVLPPSLAGRYCRQPPVQQPVGWVQCQSVAPSPARPRSAVAPNAPEADVARTERPHLCTHSTCKFSSGNRESVSLPNERTVDGISLVMLQLTFGSIDLVTTDGHQINVPVGDVDGNLSDSLSGIGVEEDSFRTTNPTFGQEGKRLINQYF